MLSYRHAFHAGNHADVFKHLVLVQVLGALLAKDKPFFYLDTHAGAGRYALTSKAAQLHREFETGIARLWHGDAGPPAVQAYLTAVRVSNPDPELRWYPGSPRIARSFLRPKDRMVLCELHPQEARVLAAEFAADRQVRVLHQDGYQALKALLPPLERRGLVHIDPAYERKDERRRLLDAFQEGYRRWATGIFALWYPIQDRAGADAWLRRFRELGIPRLLAVELTVLAELPWRLNGSGMILVNPPWRLDQTLEEVLPWLWQRLAVEGQGGYRVEWLGRA
ncbi:23S rRNA (adenine(2030)-N(6))-methyltransferase RlmJ [Candidatus Methylocalor cossyra]|uniref:Ribosomal RNA large subunit methyltransferase J n=1 Tax=Candidatus Methylocalor cossyra TaxID=3108543 RepID=A0ABM9NL23_9GAMM